MNINTLPTEILMNIFERLEAKDLKVAAQVCVVWGDICRLPGLWTWVHLSIKSWHLSQIQMMMESTRLEYLSNLTVDLGSQQLLGKALNNNKWKRLKYLNLNSCDLRASGPTVFADIIPTSLEILQLNQLTKMTQDQHEGIFRLIGERTCLNEVFLSRLDLGEMDPIFMTNITTLTTLSLSKCGLSNLQE